MRKEYRFMVGVGGIGSGMFFGLRGDDTLGRNESRAGAILPRRDFCKLHIIAHYVAMLTGAGRGGLAVLPIGKVGADPTGSAMVEHMRRAGMDIRFVTTQPGCSTLFSVCFTYPDGDGGNMTTDDSASARLTPADVEAAVEALPEVLGGDVGGGIAPSGGIALAAPEVPLEARLRLLELARQHGWLTAAAVTTAEVAEAGRMGMFRHVDVLSLNRDEAAALAGPGRPEHAEAITCAAGESLAKVNPNIRLCVTVAAAGSYGWADGAVEYTPAARVEAVNTAGAGDATLSALIVATAAGLPFIRPQRRRRERLTDAPLETALDLAALLAALAVTSPDTINFDADARALRELAGRIGADVTALEPALKWT